MAVSSSERAADQALPESERDTGRRPHWWLAGLGVLHYAVTVSSLTAGYVLSMQRFELGQPTSASAETLVWTGRVLGPPMTWLGWSPDGVVQHALLAANSFLWVLVGWFVWSRLRGVVHRHHGVVRERR